MRKKEKLSMQLLNASQGDLPHKNHPAVVELFVLATIPVLDKRADDVRMTHSRSLEPMDSMYGVALRMEDCIRRYCGTANFDCHSLNPLQAASSKQATSHWLATRRVMRWVNKKLEIPNSLCQVTFQKNVRRTESQCRG
jgi:hypothetical protein